MLVFYNIPKGYSSFNGKQVVGYATGGHPTHMTWAEYRSAKDCLIEAPFPISYLESKFNKKGFPFRAAFTLSMIRKINYRSLQKIATWLEVDSLLPHKQLVWAIRKELQDI